MAASEYTGLASSSTIDNGNGYGLLENGGNPPFLMYYPNYVDSSYHDNNQVKLYSLIISSSTTVAEDVNYIQYFSDTVSPYTINYLYGADGEFMGVQSQQYIYWLRTRTYPPNGVMPTAGFGAIN